MKKNSVANTATSTSNKKATPSARDFNRAWKRVWKLQGLADVMAELYTIAPHLDCGMYRSRIRALGEARDDLKKLVLKAPQGKNGCALILEYERVRLDRNGYSLMLFINGEPRAVVHVPLGEGEEPYLYKIYGDKEARECKRGWKEERRLFDEEYRVEREKLLRDMVVCNHRTLSGFGDWVYYKGDGGGFFSRKGSLIAVAARRSLQAVWGENRKEFSSDDHPSSGSGEKYKTLELKMDIVHHGAKHL